MRNRGMSPRTCLTRITTLILLVGLTVSARAQVVSTGSIAGKVTDTNGKPLNVVNVTIVGKPWGGFTKDDGSFQLPNIPVGTYSVDVSLPGYEEQKQDKVEVDKGQVAQLTFKLTVKPVGTIGEVDITARRNQIKTKTSETEHEISGKDVGSLPVDELTQLIALKAGVIAKGGELHFRGGRGGEVQYQVDGVPVRDPLVGGSIDLSELAVENTEQIMGGLDAQYGNAQSGVVNYQTKEGGDHFEGEVNYQTDNYGKPANTFDNLDRFFVDLGGPSPIKNLTYYVSGEGDYSDNYPATNRPQDHHRLLDFISVGNRQDNSVRLQGKLAYRPTSTEKLTAEYISNRSLDDQYFHIWSQSGYVQQITRTTPQGQVEVLNGKFSPTKIDSTYVYYNAAQHTPDFTNNTDVINLVWNHTLDASTFYTVKLNRNHFYTNEQVEGKQPWEYTGHLYQDYWFDYADNTQSDFFVIGGDYPEYSNQETISYTTKADVTKRINKHTFQTGIEATYNDMRYLQVDYPYETNSNGTIGVRTAYHYYNPEGAYYLQDRWEHEGMVLNAGLRYDVFSVGQQLTVADVQQPVKQQISPRIGLAYPISDRDAFNFAYGRYYQIPDRQFLFDNRNVFDGRVRGNPNLTNETTVSYQAGIQHLFNEVVSGQFSVYYKDIFGLLSEQQQPAQGSVGNLSTYVNQDYASARGFEATLTRRFSQGFAGEINYAFGVATGVASDPNAQSQETFTYLPISEQPLDWDVRHTLRVQLQMGDLGKWMSSFIWQYQSGFPYTPWARSTRELKPEVVNSRRLPGTTSLDIQAEKYYKVWGQSFKVFLESRNVLDAKNITDLSPQNWPLPLGRTSNDYAIYYTETGRAGGAYVGPDTNGDGIGDWVPVNDPRVFGEPRFVRMGIAYDF